MQTPVRIVFHLLLAVFTANAANKFFISDLDFELTHHFYQNIFAFHGKAPDQYRILPLLLLKYLWKGLQVIRPGAPWNHAVLLFNFLSAFAVYEVFFLLGTAWSVRKRLMFNLMFAILFIYTLYTAYRPDTLCSLLICLLTLVVWLRTSATAIHLLALTALAFTRADVALIYGVFWAFYCRKNWTYLLPGIIIPILIQVLLQKWIFPEAVYYTKPIMFWDNLGGFYLRYNPATYCIAATILLFWREISDFIRGNWKRHWVFFGLFIAYFALIFVFGRINEYRLYLPFVPLFWVVFHNKSGLQTFVWKPLTVD